MIVDNCALWDGNWIGLLARLGKEYTVGGGSSYRERNDFNSSNNNLFQPYHSTIFSTLLRILNVSVVDSRIPKPSK